MSKSVMFLECSDIWYVIRMTGAGMALSQSKSPHYPITHPSRVIGKGIDRPVNELEGGCGELPGGGGQAKA